MADVSLPSRFADEERGQLFLITALAIAVLLVSLALILNTAIYTENIATRTTDTQLDEAMSGQRVAVDASGEILDAENRNATTASEIKSQFDASMENWSESSATLEASNGFTTSVSPTVSYTEGVRIHQDDTSRNFTDASEDPDWDLTTDEEVRAIRFNVSQSSLNSTRSDAFHLVIDGDDDVTVFMHANDVTGTVVVTVENDSGAVVGSCEVEPTRGDSLVVDIGDGTVGTRHCLPLKTVREDVDGEVDVRFENGDQAEGTYELYATDRNTSLAALLGLTHYESVGSGSWPVAQEALYDVNVTFTFQSSGTTVEKEIRIAPGEL